MKKNYIYVSIIIIIVSVMIASILLKKDLNTLLNILIIGIIFSIGIILNEKILIYTSSIFFLFYMYIANKLSIMMYIPIYFYLIFIGFIIVKKKDICVKNKSIFIITILSICLSLIPLLYNKTSLVLLIWSFFKRYGFIIIILFILKLSSDSKKVIKYLNKILIYAVILSFSVSIIQFIKGLRGDLVTGLFGNSMTSNAIYIYAYFFVILIYYYHIKKCSSNILFLSLIICLIYSTIAEIKIGFIIFPMLLIIYLILFDFNVKMALIICISLLVLGILYPLYVNIYPNQDFTEEGFLKKYLVEESYEVEGQSVNRLNFKNKIDNIVFDNNSDVILGKGLGAANPSNNESFKGIVNKKYSYLRIDWFFLPYIYTETGVVGTTIYILIYIVPMIVALKIYKFNKNPISIIVILMSIINFIFMIYSSSLLTYYGVIIFYWSYYGLLIKRVDKNVI